MYQDRLGTNIGNVYEKEICFVCRLRAGNEHGIVSPRLTQVNTTILEERDPYTKDGHAFESHDYVVYPGYPDSGTACDVPGDCADTCASLTI